jgi:hypothetical protein
MMTSRPSLIAPLFPTSTQDTNARHLVGELARRNVCNVRTCVVGFVFVGIEIRGVFAAAGSTATAKSDTAKDTGTTTEKSSGLSGGAIAGIVVVGELARRNVCNVRTCVVGFVFVGIEIRGVFDLEGYCYCKVGHSKGHGYHDRKKLWSFRRGYRRYCGWHVTLKQGTW